MIKRWIIVKRYGNNSQPDVHSWLYNTKEDAVACSKSWLHVTLEYVEIELPDTMKGTYYD